MKRENKKNLQPERIAGKNSAVVNTDFFTVFAKTFKLNFSVNKSEKRIVRALADIVTGVDVCSTLTNNYCACIDELTVASFGSESFGFGITSVTG